VSKSFRTKRDAETWLKIQAVDKTRGEWVDPRRAEVQVTKWSERWLAGRRVRPSTRARDESYIRNLILPSLGHRPLGRITPDEIREWIATLESSGKAPATIRKAYQILGSIIGQAVDDGHLAKSPLPRRPGLPPVERNEMKILTLDEVHSLAQTIDPRYGAMVLTAAYTGLRPGETAGLRIDNVDLLRASLTVSGTLSEVRGAVLLGPPKTKRSARTLAISRSLAQEIGEHIGHYASSDGWIFCAPKGQALRWSNFRRRVWIPAVAAAGLGPIRFHDLRHTHAAWLIAQGEHAKVISERLGHSSITVTFDVYGHLMPGMDEGVAERLDDAWQRTSGDETRTTRAPSRVTEIHQS
jgi:integrase